MLNFVSRFVSIAVVSTALLATPALAQGTGSEGYFTLHNDTEGNVLIRFLPQDGLALTTLRLLTSRSPSTSARPPMSISAIPRFTTTRLAPLRLYGAAQTRLSAPE